MNNPTFQVTAVPRATFAPLFELSDDELTQRGIYRLKADKKPYYPCRVSLVDAEPGESVLMLSFKHLTVHSPYESSGPIFVREAAVEAHPAAGELPEMLRPRLMAVRAYDGHDKMLGAEVCEGTATATLIEQFFTDPRVDYLHLHNAKIGCFFCRVNRA